MTQKRYFTWPVLFRFFLASCRVFYSAFLFLLIRQFCRWSTTIHLYLSQVHMYWVLFSEVMQFLSVHSSSTIFYSYYNNLMFYLTLVRSVSLTSTTCLLWCFSALWSVCHLNDLVNDTCKFPVPRVLFTFFVHFNVPITEQFTAGKRKSNTSRQMTSRNPTGASASATLSITRPIDTRNT